MAGFEGLEDASPSVATGVGTLLVAGVEYSLSDDAPTGVGTEETDSLPATEALLGLPRECLTPGGAISVEEGDAAAELSMLDSREAREGLPLGRFVVGVELLGAPTTSTLSLLIGCRGLLDELERVRRPISLPDPLTEATRCHVSCKNRWPANTSVGTYRAFPMQEWLHPGVSGGREASWPSLKANPGRSTTDGTGRCLW